MSCQSWSSISFSRRGRCRRPFLRTSNLQSRSRKQWSASGVRGHSALATVASTHAPLVQLRVEDFVLGLPWTHPRLPLLAWSTPQGNTARHHRFVACCLSPLLCNTKNFGKVPAARQDLNILYVGTFSELKLGLARCFCSYPWSGSRNRREGL